MDRTRSVRVPGTLRAVLLLVLLAGCGPAPSDPPAATEPAPPGPNAGLTELRIRIRDGAGPRGAIIQALAEATADDPAALAGPALALVTWAEGELAWLDEHQPEACYEPAHTAYGDALAALASAATLFAEIAEGAGPIEQTGPEAAAALSQATDGIAQAEGMALAAGNACR